MVEAAVVETAVVEGRRWAWDGVTTAVELLLWTRSRF